MAERLGFGVDRVTECLSLQHGPVGELQSRLRKADASGEIGPLVGYVNPPIRRSSS